MSPTEPGSPRRLALVLARHGAASGAPPGVSPAAFAEACLADTYEVLADLVQVVSGIAGDGPEVTELLWPGALQVPGDLDLRALAASLTGRYDELVVVPADVPDLPGLVLAKVFKALHRADVCVAAERGDGGGCVALGVRLPWPGWIDGGPVPDLDRDPSEQLRATAPRPDSLATVPGWHRMRTPLSVQRLDPGLEGWDLTRALLSGTPRGAR